MTAPHEVLHLTIEVVEMEILWRKEIVFGSDHLVFSRTSWKSNPNSKDWETHGWLPVMAGDAQATWSDEGALTAMADQAHSKGWQAEWHPQHGTVSKDFVREASFH